jgi:hypothetical protein
VNRLHRCLAKHPGHYFFPFRQRDSLSARCDKGPAAAFDPEHLLCAKLVIDLQYGILIYSQFVGQLPNTRHLVAFLQSARGNLIPYLVDNLPVYRRRR